MGCTDRIPNLDVFLDAPQNLDALNGRVRAALAFYTEDIGVPAHMIYPVRLFNTVLPAGYTKTLTKIAGEVGMNFANFDVLSRCSRYSKEVSPAFSGIDLPIGFATRGFWGMFPFSDLDVFNIGVDSAFLAMTR
jgi:hypothetical protein